MDCDVKVCFLPRSPLEEIVKNRALEAAKKIHGRTALHMDLEAQATSPVFQEDQMQETADELIRNRDRRLWED
jgi:hypothetical protein